MDDQTKQKLIEKIRKLLALAGSSNEHEAALVTERAQAMLAEYNLSMTDVQTKAEKEADVTHEHVASTSSHPWRRPLANAVAQMYFCTYFYTSAGSRDFHYFVGEPHNIIVAQMMFQYLIKTIDGLAMSHARKLPESQRSPYRTTFRGACTRRVCARIYQRIAAASRGEVKAEGGTNLPALANLYLTAQRTNEDYTEKAMGTKPKEKKQNLAMLRTDGVADGDAAGRSIGLDTQITEAEKARAIGK